MNLSLQRSIKLYLVLAAGLSLVFALGSLAYFSQAQNKQAMETESKLVAGGVAAFFGSGQTVSQGIANWVEASHRVEERNHDWLWSNLAPTIQASDVVDLVVFLPKDNEAPFGWTRKARRSNPQAGLIPEAILRRLRSAATATKGAQLMGVQIVAYVEDRPLLLTARVMGEKSPATLQGPSDLNVVIIGSYLDERLAQRIGATYTLNSLRFSSAPEFGLGNYPIRDFANEVGGYLVWEPSRPGSETLRSAALPLGIYIGIFVLAILLVSRRASTLAFEAARNEQIAKTAAETDRLTGLANRVGFTSAVERITAPVSPDCPNDPDCNFAIVFVDLNGFKSVNDSAGHAAGDAVLESVADRLRRAAPEGTLIARIGGDEFACLVPTDRHGNGVQDFARRAARAIDVPIRHGELEFNIHASIGYSVACPDNACTAEEIVRRADLAMYRAKTEKLVDPLAYTPDMEAGLRERSALNAAMRKGLPRGEFYVEYHPILSGRTGEIVMAEALLRWKRPVVGICPPDQFIPVAEEFGFIQDLGLFVLREACRLLSRGTLQTIAVNLSPVQLRNPDLCNTFLDILAEYGIEPERIEIELTEGVLISSPELARRHLNAFAEAGFGISLDDYGTGFSSLGYLREFPLHAVKIDKSFLQNCDTDPRRIELLQSLSLLARSFEIRAVAEGVETAAQVEFLRLMGYDLMQGFFFARPMPADALEDYVIRHQADFARANDASDVQAETPRRASGAA